MAGRFKTELSIAKIRHAYGLTINQLCQIIAVTPVTYHRYKRGDSSPDIRVREILVVLDKCQQKKLMKHKLLQAMTEKGRLGALYVILKEN